MANNVREIAKKAGVSVATVSRVLHQSDKVREETRQKVQQAMQTLGLTAEELVRSAKTDSHVVGVLIPDLTNSFFIEVMRGIEDYAQTCGMKLIICHTREADSAEIQYLRLLKEMQVGGIIITPISDDDDSINNEYLDLLSNMKIPVVLIDRDVKYLKHEGVFIDNEKGAYDATKLLIENGHRHIAFIGGPLNTIPGRGRKKGYCDALKHMGLPPEEELIYNGDFSMQSGELITEEILKRHPQVTAIFAANNHMTIGCLAKLQKEGYRVPEDIAVIGFDDIPVLDRLGFHITVVDRPDREMGRQAAKLMVKRLNGQKAEVGRRIMLMPKLIVRGSERLCRKTDV